MNSKLKSIKWNLKNFYSFINEEGPLTKIDTFYSTNEFQFTSPIEYINESKKNDPNKNRKISKLGHFKLNDSVGIINTSCPTNPFIEAIGICIKIEEIYDLFEDNKWYWFDVKILEGVKKKFNISGNKTITISECDRFVRGEIKTVTALKIVKSKQKFKNFKRDKQMDLTEFFKSHSSSTQLKIVKSIKTSKKKKEKKKKNNLLNYFKKKERRK
jgi:hypothetical protein